MKQFQVGMDMGSSLANYSLHMFSIRIQYKPKQSIEKSPLKLSFKGRWLYHFVNILSRPVNLNPTTR